MKVLKTIVLFVVIFLFSIFVMQNTQLVNVNIFGTTYQLPLFLLILILLFGGIGLTSLVLMTKHSFLTGSYKTVLKSLAEFYRGYTYRSGEIARKALRKYDEAKALYVQALESSEGLQENISSESGLSEALVGKYALIKRDTQKAKEYSLIALQKDPKNLTALKTLRDAHYLEGLHQEALNYQESVLKLSERWEKDINKRILSELLILTFINSKDEKQLERARDTYGSFFVLAEYIYYLLQKGKQKDVRKELEGAFEKGLQNELLLILSEKGEEIREILPMVEERQDSINKDILALFYMRLNLVSKLEDLQTSVSENIELLISSYKLGGTVGKLLRDKLKALNKMWVCTICGKEYNFYVPMCDGCFTWGKVNSRRG